jgi:hypothetical protein
MEEHILFHGEGFPDGIAGLTLTSQVNLVRDYLPNPPHASVPEMRGILSLPQPDSCLGYMTAVEAKRHRPPLARPFNDEEEGRANWYITPFFIATLLANPAYRYNVLLGARAHFPFLTALWKCASSGEGHFQASIQAARDGALIVNYMHHFYSLAYPYRHPTPLETCHFSITVDGYTVML